MPNTNQINDELEFQENISKKSTDEKVDWLCWHIYQQSKTLCSQQTKYDTRFELLESSYPKIEKRLTSVESVLKDQTSKPMKTNIVGGLTGGGIGAAIGAAVIELINFFQFRGSG
jgi:hypothetical protein